MGSIGGTRGLPVHSGSLGFARAHLRVVGFIWVPVDSILRTYLWSGSSGFAWVLSGARTCHQVHSDSLGISRARLVVVGFIRVRVCSLGRAYRSSGSFGFA